jgi:Mn-dependent DtxR family transcriptional regulator
MPQISSKTKNRISEHILSHLFSQSPEPLYTNAIARELARDEEFIKSMLQELETKKLVVKINKNEQGEQLTRRTRWRLSNTAFDAYSRMQK